MKEVSIYTDGACKGNPGPGGWGAILIYGGMEKELQGYEESTTNNRMELTAAINGLSALNRPCRVKIYSDSAYLVNAFQKGWIDKWMRNNWLAAGGQPVENRDLWEILLSLTRKNEVKWIKVSGHSGDKYNARCDALATGAIKMRLNRGRIDR
ncbi:MAG: ribonuclease HI [Bacillota bacterium]